MSSASVARGGGDAPAVRVFVRFRPQNALEESEGGHGVVKYVSEHACVVSGSSSFTFDRIFAPDASQADVYEQTAREIVESVLDGYNGTVLAYGQTSSGKTHTMEGPSIDDVAARGIVPRMVSTLFDGVRAAPPTSEFVLGLSMLEIYMERIRDLLAEPPSADAPAPSLAIHEDRSGGTFVAGLTREYVSSEEEVFALLRRGAKGRATGATRMNEGSSRSHSVVLVLVRQRDTLSGSVRTGRLCLVDLAGSEKVAKTQASGVALKEAQTINKSLSALGNVINALTAESAAEGPAHVPYRDSKLTRVLQESLGGNARTALIVTCSASSYNADETLSSLRFGQRAKRMRNKPVVNREPSAGEYKALLLEEKRKSAALEEEVGALRAMLGGAAEAGDGGAAAEAAARTEQLRSLMEQLDRERASRLAAEHAARESGEALRAETARAADLEDECAALADSTTLLEAEAEELYTRLATVEVELEKAARARDAAAEERASLAEQLAALAAAGAPAAAGSRRAEWAAVAAARRPSASSVEGFARRPSASSIEPVARRPSASSIEPVARRPSASSIVEAAARAGSAPAADAPPAAAGSPAHAPAPAAHELVAARVDALASRCGALEEENAALFAGLQAKIQRVIDLEIELDGRKEAQRRMLNSLGAWELYDELEELRSEHARLGARHARLEEEHERQLVALRVAEAKVSTRSLAADAWHASHSAGAGAPAASPGHHSTGRVHKPRPTLRGRSGSTDAAAVSGVGMATAATTLGDHYFSFVW